MDTISARRRMALALSAGALLLATVASPAFAADTVILAITGSGLTASVADLTLTSVPYQNAAHNVSAGRGGNLIFSEGGMPLAGWVAIVLAGLLLAVILASIARARRRLAGAHG